MSGRLFLVGIFAIVLSVPALAADEDNFLASFRQQVENGIVLRNAQGECRVNLKRNSPPAGEMQLEVNMKSSWTGGIRLGATVDPLAKLEKINQWNWGTTDNLGRDMYRYVTVVSPGLGSDYVNEVVVTVAKETRQVLTFVYRQYRFKSARLATLAQPFTDIVSVATNISCFR